MIALWLVGGFGTALISRIRDERTYKFPGDFYRFRTK